jgi:hypothetical protein
MVLTVIHPSYFPSLPYLGKFLYADRCVYSDNFYFKKQSTINRCQIKTCNGPHWLTIPVFHSQEKKQKINEILIDNHSTWHKKHILSLTTNYTKSPFFYYYIDDIFQMLNRQWTVLNDLVLFSLSFILHKLGIYQSTINSSSLSFIRDRTLRILNWLETCNCDTYLIEQYEIPLVDVQFIKKHGFKIRQYSYRATSYHQQYSSFIPNLSALDLLFNEGEASKNFIYKNSSIL